MSTMTEVLNQLRAARDIVLQDPTPYPQVVAGILPVVSPSAQLEARRWGADFLAEAFASQVVSSDMKQQMAILVLDTLDGWLDRKKSFGEEEDVCVVKSAIQCAASIYPFVFRHTVDRSDQAVWAKVSEIKSSILGMMDTATPGVRICCLKFATCVVQTQTPGVIADPRRPEQNEISLALVPREHSVVSASILEAQASGLLDRILSVLQDSAEDALIVTALLNALSPLVQKRPSIATKIIPAVLNFDPLRLANKPMTVKDKLCLRSMTRTTMSFLLSSFKLMKNNPFAGRIQQHLDRLKHSLNEALTGSHQLKRRAPDAAVPDLEDSKRQRLSESAPSAVLQPAVYPPLPEGPVSLAQVFTLTTDFRAATFPAHQLSGEIVTQLIPAIVATLNADQIERAVAAVRSRLSTIASKAANFPKTAVTTGALEDGDEDDDDDYDPLAAFSEGADTTGAPQVAEYNPLENNTNEVAIGPFSLPKPQPLTAAERDNYSKTSLTRVFETLTELDREAKLKDVDKDSKAKNKPAETNMGLSRMAASTLNGHDREGWVALLTRLATRASLELPVNDVPKQENNQQHLLKNGHGFDLANGIRQALMNYVMENFRARIDVAIMWLSEEWYSGQILQSSQKSHGDESSQDALSTYWNWTLKLFSAMITYFDIRDGKILIRFLSEVPAINQDMLRQAKKIAEDPDRVQLTVNALLYLIMMRPPVRSMAIDCVEEIWRENDDAKPAAAKILAKHRPSVLEGQQSPVVKAEA